DARIHNARLMLAEGHFQAGNFGPAAAAYGKIDLQHIAAENHPGLRYRLASALLQSGQREAALLAFNVFIEKHPDHPQAAHAIVKRAESFMEAGELPQAHREFERLIAVATDHKLKEYAWVQKARLYKEANDLPRFADCHRHLLTDFPNREPRRLAASQFWLGWALYRQDKFEDCLEPFQRARMAEPKELGRESTLHLALAKYQLQRRDELKSELDTLLRDYPKEKIPRPVFAWLGTAFASTGNHQEAWRYLRHAITPREPTKTKVVVWRAAGRSALEAGACEEALRPLEIVLQVEENDFRKAETNFLLARAHFTLKDPERARKAAEACLAFKPQGELNARARLLLGDIAMSQGDPNTGAGHYVV
ncbi:MAG: tetratricopeptide repeat protein, partial [Akkermansiaceae bacterium]|nr:tetratricopeptide repeat protein [Akkermansiaceae bacterium]